jgi:hypothetical protein
MDALFDASKFDKAYTERAGKIEAHHVLFPRRWWTIYEPYQRTRETGLLIPKIDAITHNALHRTVTIVPVPDFQTMSRVSKDFIPVRDDPISSVEALRDSFDRVTQLDGTNTLQRNLAGLTMNALDLQIKFISDGLVR